MSIRNSSQGRVPDCLREARYLLIILRHRRHEAFAEAGFSGLFYAKVP